MNSRAVAKQILSFPFSDIIKNFQPLGVYFVRNRWALAVGLLSLLWYHLPNLAFHLASVLLLFRVFLGMSGNPWQSGFVAALFALHPLNVEPVAWVAERKGILCTFFWMLTLWSYLRYLERPKIPNYPLILFFFVLGFMAKPMIVTLPFVLLLLDYWPLHRFQPGRPSDGRDSESKSFDPRLV